MIGTKEQKVLSMLMQYGYDRNVIAMADMNGIDCSFELENEFEDLTKAVIRDYWNWYESNKRDYDDETKEKTIMRFCYTAGIGAAWLWENKKDEVEAKGLYNCMVEPRTAYRMDEYIEDITGIWWSSKSLNHLRNLRILSGCYFDIIQKEYDLKDKVQEQNAGHVMMFFGMYVEYSRIYHERAIIKYNGDDIYNADIWDRIYGEQEHAEINEDENDKNEFYDWTVKTILEGKRGLGNEVILDDPNSKYGKKTKYYYQITYNEKAGLRTMVYLEDEKVNILTSTPIFDTSRRYYIIIDDVYVFENGAEAVIRAHFFDDENFKITFYDTSYLENKDRYFVGCTYCFDLYAMAYQARIVPEDERSFTIEGENAVKFKNNIGEEPEYDENGNPLPVVIQAGNMHSFLQIKENSPADAEFRSPIKAIYDDVDFLGKKVYEVEIEMPYHDDDKDGENHPLSVFISGEPGNNFTERPVVGDPIHGISIIYGKMRSFVNMKEIPSNVVHTFTVKDKDGNEPVINHDCEEAEKGKPMTEDEKKEFAKKVYLDLLSSELDIDIVDKPNDKTPDFKVERNRDIWIKADSEYSAEESFKNEDKTAYLYRAYTRNRLQVIAYITLFDENGNKCEWQKGGKYKASISYGSVWPGQKMELRPYYNHDDLVEELFESFEKSEVRTLITYLHKDLDFRSHNLPDPLITRDEYLIRTERINNLRKDKEGPIKPVLLHSPEDGAYIELNYPEGGVDVVKVGTYAGFITSIKIDKK